MALVREEPFLLGPPLHRHLRSEHGGAAEHMDTGPFRIRSLPYLEERL
jgi:hypothetical protein